MSNYYSSLSSVPEDVLYRMDKAVRQQLYTRLGIVGKVACNRLAEAYQQLSLTIPHAEEEVVRIAVEAVARHSMPKYKKPFHTAMANIASPLQSTKSSFNHAYAETNSQLAYMFNN